MVNHHYIRIFWIIVFPLCYISARGFWVPNTPPSQRVFGALGFTFFPSIKQAKSKIFMGFVSFTNLGVANSPQINHQEKHFFVNTVELGVSV